MRSIKQSKISIHKLPLVPNICRQLLREVWKSKKTSLAHVSMRPGNVSLLHKHKNFTELYYILSGKGIITLGNNAFTVRTDDLIVIPPNKPHKLKNAGRTNLTHLVIASPAFNPKDVILIKK